MAQAQVVWIATLAHQFAGIIAGRAPAPRRMQQCEEDCAIGSVARLRLPSAALLCHRPDRPSRHAARPVAVPNGAPSNPAAADPALARAASRGHAYGFRASLRGPKAECVRNRTFLTASAKVTKWRSLLVPVADGVERPTNSPFVLSYRCLAYFHRDALLMGGRFH